MAGANNRDADKASVEEQGALFADAVVRDAVPANGGQTAAAQKPRKTKAAPTNDDKLGHRERLRNRFRQGGAQALHDYELLEMMLFSVFPRGDTKPLAKRLIAEFKTFAEVVQAPRGRILAVAGAGERVADELKLIRVATERMLQLQVHAQPCLTSGSSVLDYLRLAQGYEMREHFRVLFLDKKNNLIADEVQGVGTVDHTPVYVREVVKRALDHSATAIILVHNHPSGDPTPSRADIDVTKMIIEAARPLGVSVHDHIIVGRNGYSSLRALKLV